MNSSNWAFMVAALVSIIVGSPIINALTKLKIRQTICTDAPERHRQKQGTPTMGGVIIFLGAILGSVAGLICLPARSGLKVVAAIGILTLANAALGFLDDYLIVARGKNLGLKARQKLLGQFIIAIGFVAFAAYIHPDDFTRLHLFGRKSIELGLAYYPFAVLLVVGMSNAVNLTDGLDGLVASLSTVVVISLSCFLTFLSVSPSPIECSNEALLPLSWALAGGCLGFLWHNCYPAKVFMGDTGSLAIGAALAGIAILGKQEVMLLMIGAIFVIEALSVIIQVVSFKTTGKRIFRMSPIHHHFELCGWPEQKIVVRFVIVQILIAFAILFWMPTCR